MAADTWYCDRRHCWHVLQYSLVLLEEVAKLGDSTKLFAFKDTAWRSIFWVSLPPGILFVIGTAASWCRSLRVGYSVAVSETPRVRWRFSRTSEQAGVEMAEDGTSSCRGKSKILDWGWN